MALGQTLAVPKSIFLCTPRTSLIPSTSLNPNPTIRLLPSTSETNKSRRRFSSHGGVKCSGDYNTNTNGYSDKMFGVPTYPRPSEIPWQKEIANSVHLIGYVANDVQMRNVSGGKSVAICRLAIKKSPSETSWILLSFWDEMAHVAIQHLQKNNQIYVCGRLVVDTVETVDGKEQTYHKVNVKHLNFIERYSSVDDDSNLATPGKQVSAFARNSTPAKELWQAFFANPADWWDNRKDKATLQKHPKYPDFKHKHTGEVLWVDSRYNPPWVMSQLEILDSRREVFEEQNNGMNVNFGAGDKYSTL